MNEATTRWAGSVCVDQVVFTSVRLPMGQGYRIIAASPGVGSDEKMEITRRAPSHASLCETEPDAVALLAHPLTSGRYCVALSQYAGEEQTARGGQRVHTHIVVLDQPTYLRFGCNPVRAHAALARVVRGTPALEPPPRLGQLSLSIALWQTNGSVVAERAAAPGIERDTSVKDRHRQTEHILHIALALLQGERLLVVGAREELDLLNKTLITLPLAVRRSLAISAGLKHSPSRQLQICLAARDQGEEQRAIRGQKIRWFDVEAAPPRPSSSYDTWLGFAGRWLATGRQADLEWLTAEMTDDLSPAALARTASICSDIESVETADQPKLAERTATTFMDGAGCTL